MVSNEFRYASHPEDARTYDTETLRKHFLVSSVFVEGQIKIVYSMYDRYIVGGVMPTKSPLLLDTVSYLRSEYFLERRELGIINVGGKGSVTVNGTPYILEKKRGSIRGAR